MRQQVPGAEEDQATHADQVVGIRVEHYRRHLALLVPRYIYAPLDTQSRQFVVFFILLFIIIL